MATEVLTTAVFQEATGWVLAPEHVERIRAALGGAGTLHVAGSRAELLAALPETTLLVGCPLTAEELEREGPKVRWVQLTDSVGDALPPLAGAMQRGVRFTTAASIRGPQLAEHAMALALALLRRLDAAILAQAEHEWAATEIAPRLRTLRGATVGVIAFGAIADELATRAHAFGTRVLCTALDDAPERLHVDSVFGLRDVDKLLAASDVVIVAIPEMPATMGLLDRRRLAKLAPQAIVVTLSSAAVVDLDALLDALRRQRIAGAALDAFDTTPLPTTSSLWTMPNVIVSPGIAAACAGYWDLAVEVIGRNVRRIIEGRPLIDEARPSWYLDVVPVP